MKVTSPVWRRLSLCAAAAVIAAASVTSAGSNTPAYADVQVLVDQKKGADGKHYSVKNHLVPDLARSAEEDGNDRKKWLLVWAGDENIADTAVGDVKDLPGTLAGGVDKVKNALPGPDFLAVIDATHGSE